MNSLRIFGLVIFVTISCLLACKSTTNQMEQPLTIKHKEQATDILKDTIATLMEKYHIPGLSLAILIDGKLSETKTYGVIQKGKEEKINTETMFSVGSISKVVNAFLTLRLVQLGKLDLEADVNHYLKGWHVPVNEFSRNNPITLRKLLSHTAGLSVHGFDDYYPEESLPTTVEILNGTGRAKSEKVELIFRVGSRFKYSGGGITIIQKIIEDVTSLPYHEAAKLYLFQPLELQRISYENPIPTSLGNIAKAHNGNGEPEALPRGYQAMPEKAASGLWVTPKALANLLTILMEAYEEQNEQLFSRAIIEDMISPEPNTLFGLGPETETRNGETIIFHDGANDSYRAHFKIFWHQKNGYVIFTNGTNGIPLIKVLNPILDQYLTGEL